MGGDDQGSYCKAGHAVRGYPEKKEEQFWIGFCILIRIEQETSSEIY